MNKEEYISEIENDVSNLLQDYKLINYKNQAFAWKLNAKFNRTFQEDYLWNRALFLSTNSCILLQNNRNLKVALIGLYESAEIFEYLNELPEIEEKYDKDYILILSALCYDLSGYQANAYCVTSRIKSYKLTTSDEGIDLTIDNHLVEQIRLILLKKIPFAHYSNHNKSLNNELGFQVVKQALDSWYSYILKLQENDYESKIDKAYKYFLFSGNTYLSHLLFLLKTRILLFDNRNIWNRISNDEDIKTNHYWKKYAKLLAHDYYTNSSIKDIEERKSIFEFWTSQLRAIEKGLIDLDDNFVVQMPTSAGKTFIAELSILKYLIKYPNKKCIYIAPFRALTNEKEIELSKYLSKLGFSVSSLSGSYEIDEFQDVILSETDLLIATPEKVDLLLRINPDFFNNISFIVVDEGHIIGDISTRATLLEFLIIRLKIKIPKIKTLFISAVMPPQNADEYSLWLSGKENNILRSLKFNDSDFNEEWEPTRKLISYFEWVGSSGNITFENVITEDEETKIKQGAKLYSFLKDKEFANIYPHKNVKKETAAALAFKLSEGGNTLVFCAQVQRIKSVANALLSLLSVIEVDEIPKRFQLNENKKSSYYSKIWFRSDSFITKSINYGIGIHYGDMPEQVRTAVEDDFRNGNLTVLLSTNTIGQGLNFSIKNLIFYETQIGRINSRNKYIQYRDFWNIVGRAGRAGKETEGNIVFIINTQIDRRLYDKFKNKDNIEQADSLFYKILNLLLENRVKYKKGFLTDLSTLSETYLLDLLTEEVIGTEYEEIINKIIDNSLFKVQIEKHNLDIRPIKKGFKKIFKSFENETSFEQLETYRITGFSFRSNKIIDNFIEENKDDLELYVENDDFLSIVKLYLEMVTNNEIDEIKDYKLDRLNIYPINYLGIIENWIGGKTIQDLIMEWETNHKKDVISFHIFISKALYYLYPWGITSFLVILAYRLKKKIAELPENIKNLTSFIKYGVNNSTSCLARSLGIKSRQVSLFLYEESNYLEGKQFIRWLSNLTNEEIYSFDISGFDRDNLKTVSLKLTPSSYRTDISEFQFFIKGTYFNNDWHEISKNVNIGEKLNYKRDEHNKFDTYAILILKGTNEFGYVPREYSKFIASEIDIEETKYEIIIVNINDKEEYKEIEIRMTKSG
ncbi:DEAD/DEAH box helicase [bacterium]|nr:DEAD/DEAH box helicase [bacterium]